MTPESSSSKAPASQIEDASGADGNGGAYVLVQTPNGAQEDDSRQGQPGDQRGQGRADVIGVQTAYDGPGNPTMIDLG